MVCVAHTSMADFGITRNPLTKTERNILHSMFPILVETYDPTHAIYVTLNSMGYFKYHQNAIFHVWMSRRVRTKFRSKGSLY